MTLVSKVNTFINADSRGVFNLVPHRNDFISRVTKSDLPLPTKAYDSIGMLDGFRVIMRKEDLPDVSCYKYVALEIVKKNKISVTISQLANPINYLPTIGYRQVFDYPNDGDIIAYHKNQDNSYPHIGIFTDGKVVSKWGEGHLYSHPINAVPESYGDSFLLFRK